MTLKELIDSVSDHKNGHDIAENRAPDFDVPQAGCRKQVITVCETRDESQPGVRFTSRTGPAERRVRADQYEPLIYKTDVH
jgi:hypothetical protein